MFWIGDVSLRFTWVRTEDRSASGYMLVDVLSENVRRKVLLKTLVLGMFCVQMFRGGDVFCTLYLCTYGVQMLVRLHACGRFFRERTENVLCWAAVWIDASRRIQSNVNTTTQLYTPSWHGSEHRSTLHPVHGVTEVHYSKWRVWLCV
jgi:hypothetical protein